MRRHGIYYWAGPGTERMIQLKYPQARVDSLSFYRAYDQDRLQLAREKLGVTDAWVTFSWGFSQKTELPDYQFIHERLANFKTQEIKTHAYVQGTNLVYEEHKDQDYYCRDHRGHLIPYHRGRKLTCVNNPHFVGYLRSKIELALKEAFDGVFVDNMHFGLFPLITGRHKTTFFGCRCRYCQQLFKIETGSNIPSRFMVDSFEFYEYLHFRSRSLTRLMRTISADINSSGKAFGTNSFDPKLDPKFFYGIDIKEAAKYQDYLLFENHDLPRKKKNNLHLQPIIDSTKKPVFIVSYKKGIGREPKYTQSDFDSVYTESLKLGYNPCFKATEYTTNGWWHALDFTQLQPVEKFLGLRLTPLTIKRKQVPFSILNRLYNRWYVPGLNMYFENPLVRKAMSWVYYQAIK